jgi:hemoglobin-like flavoprotein
MGHSCSRLKVDTSEERYTENDVHHLESMDNDKTITIDHTVRNHIPPILPLKPRPHLKMRTHCRNSWSYIESREFCDEDGFRCRGTTHFWKSFYDKCVKADIESCKKLYLRRSRQDNVSINCGVMRYLLQFADIQAEEDNIFKLANQHKQYHVLPMEYSKFIVLLLATIFEHLDNKATEEVMLAWKHLATFVLQRMILYSLESNIQSPIL